MADEDIIEQPSPSEARIKQLSGLVRTTSEERDEKDRLYKEESSKRESVEKERDFYAGFSDIVATNPSAKEHKDEILTKVKGGYSVEDATFAVLGKAGKLGQKAPEPVNPAGGSATVTPPQGGNKSVGEMSQAEKRAALEKEVTWT